MRARLAIAMTAAAVLAGPLPAQVTEVQLAPPLLRLRPGAQIQVLATAYNREGAPVDARLFWSSTNINVATVDSLGRVVAVAPGFAIISATADTANPYRRGTGRTTVFVSHSQATGGKQLAGADTIAPAECDEMEFGLRNPGRACWDTRPSLRASAIVAAPPSCAGSPTVSVTPVIFHVRVNMDGSVREVRVANPSTCDAYRQMASELLTDICCRPAWRRGRPVAAWTVVVVRPPSPSRVIITPAPPVPAVPGAPGTAPRAPRGPAPGKQGPRP